MDVGEENKKDHQLARDAAHNIVEAQIDKKIFDREFLKNVFSTAIGAFVGAILAFGFGMLLFGYQENQKVETERSKFLEKLKSEIAYNQFITDDLIKYNKKLRELDEYNYKLNIGVKNEESGLTMTKNYKNLYQFNLLLQAFENNIIFDFLTEKEAANLKYSIFWNKELNEFITKFWDEKRQDQIHSFDNLSFVIGEQRLSLSDLSGKLKSVDSKIK